MGKIEKLTTMIKEQVICNKATFMGYESRINERYVPVFDDAWMDCFERLKDIDLTHEQSSQLNVLRETAYKATYNLTQDPDLAALVSDDFELIGKAAVTSIAIPWLNGLWIAYRNSTFPTGKVQEHEGDLGSFIT